MKIDYDFFKRIIDISSVSGTEYELQKVWLDYIKKYCDTTDRTFIGNAEGVINQKSAFSVLITAHCDQIGFMVSNIDEDGFVHVIQVGDYHPQAMPGSTLSIFSSKGVVEGVFGIKTSHMSEDDELSKIKKLPDLWVDIGAKNKKEAEKLVTIGDFAVIKSQFRKSPNGYITGPGMDDKAGVYVIAAVLKELSKQKINVKVTGASVVHEEITGGGISELFERHSFDAAIFLDTGFASDFPGNNKNKWGNIKLADGPIISSSSTINNALRNHLISVATAKKIPFQHFAEGSRSGTDLDTRYYKVPSALISIPCRYMHTPIEIIHSKDIENTVKLCCEFVKSLKGTEKFDPFLRTESAKF